MRFVLYRILGNDLPPRHDEDQTYKNTKFILENEPDFPNCEKRWLLNRIVDPEKAAALRDLLGHNYEEIPFNPQAYRLLPKTPQAKIHYLANVNKARNTCLRLSKHQHGATHVMPSDGGCLFQLEGWNQLVQTIAQNPATAYFATPTWRMGENSNYTQVPNPETTYFSGKREIKSPGEPQMTFGPDYDAVFNENLPYALVDKVELLWRIGLRGRWDDWEPHIRKQAETKKSKHYGKCRSAGVICRAGANTKELQQEQDNRIRGKRRHEGILNLVKFVDDLTS